MIDSLTGYFLIGVILAALIEYGIIKNEIENKISWGVRITMILFWPYCVVMILYGYFKGLNNRDK